MKLFRKVIFWLHLAAGVLAGIFIFVMCVTGALLSFESNILEYAEREMRVVEVPSESQNRLPVQELVAKVLAEKPNAKPSNITLQTDKMASATVTLGREGQVFINPYTGAIIGEGAKGWRGFFRVVEDAHRWLALSGGRRNVGKSINDAANLLFLFLAISGVYIWLPRRLNWKHFKAATVFRSKVKGKARDFNWHTVIGFWTSLMLIILTLTGVVISYQWAGNLVYTLTGNEVPQQQQAPPNVPNQQAEQLFVLPENLNDLWTKAETHTPYKTISLRLPIAKDSAVFTIEEGIYWNIFARSTLTIDAKSAEVAKWESYGEQNSGRQLRSWIRFTHTGETGGIIGQFIGFLACVGGAFLVWTGISLALRRFGNWRTDKRNA
ncbi:MAG TPA: PepSY-associated TM helix domain-containing protein [Pyrinomonadaceae bacterium]|nr:PepSY-associated TM helix domain-containing protein [Pyrinomonadaceae bacterium]